MVKNISVALVDSLRMRENPVKDIHIGANTSLEDLISQFGEA